MIPTAALRGLARQACRSSAPRRWNACRGAATAAAVPTSGAARPSETEIKRKASLPNPDPTPDSASAALVGGHEPFMVRTYARPLPVMVKGEGCYVWDIENRRYLDFMAGIAVNALGHADEGLMRVINDQVQTLMHSSNLYYNAWTGELARLLVEKTKESGGMRDAARIFVANSGSEANEAAIKFCRKVGKTRDPSGEKNEIVSFHGSFHGRTMGALSATPNTKYQKPFAPMLPGFRYGTFNETAGLDELITDKTCGVLIEPIQGEGGVHVATPAFLSALRARCDAVGALLVYDEIQSGLARTGALWAHAAIAGADGAHPDVLTTAKALGNGYPVGATVVSEAVADCIVTGDHGTTFGGGPLASRVAHHMVGRLAERELLDGVKDKERVFRKGFEVLREKYPEIITEVRGKGLILALQLDRDPTPVVTAARERGLLVITAGVNTLRFLPPLVISEAEIEEGLGILGEAFEEAFGKR